MSKIVTLLFVPVSILFGVAMTVHASSTDTNHWTFDNPKNNLEFRLSLDNGRLSYLISFQGTSIIDSSKLSIARDDVDFSNSLSFVEESGVVQRNDQYSMLVGKSKKLHDKHSERTFTFQHRSGPLLEIVVRAYGEGFAFRYGFPEREENPVVRIVDDSTSFAISRPGKAWMLPYEGVSTWSPSYEMEWQNAIDIGGKAPEDMKGWAFPALMRTGGKWLFISEAGVDGSGFVTHLEPDPTGREYKTALPLKEETYGVAPRYATSTLPWSSPWKVVMVTEDLSTIV